FGVMLSMEPMVGVLAGFLILGEKLSVRSLIACVLVSIAAAGAARYGISQESNHTQPPPAA
ncbi:MAG: EamA family transporter, partial [Cyanobacteria bacterium J06635_11]